MTQQTIHETFFRRDTEGPSSERSFRLVMAAALSLLTPINGWHSGRAWSWLAGANGGLCIVSDFPLIGLQVCGNEAEAQCDVVICQCGARAFRDGASEVLLRAVRGLVRQGQSGLHSTEQIQRIRQMILCVSELIECVSENTRVLRIWDLEEFALVPAIKTI